MFLRDGFTPQPLHLWQPTMNLTIQASYFPENPVAGANNLLGSIRAEYIVSKTPYGITELNQIKDTSNFCCPGNRIHYDGNAEFYFTGWRWLLPDHTYAQFTVNSFMQADEDWILEILYFACRRVNIRVLQHFNSPEITHERDVLSTLSNRGLRKFFSDLQVQGYQLSLFTAHTANLSSRVPLTLNAFMMYRILLHSHRIVAEYTQM